MLGKKFLALICYEEKREVTQWIQLLLFLSSFETFEKKVYEGLQFPTDKKRPNVSCGGHCVILARQRNNSEISIALQFFCVMCVLCSVEGEPGNR